MSRPAQTTVLSAGDIAQQRHSSGTDQLMITTTDVEHGKQIHPPYGLMARESFCVLCKASQVVLEEAQREFERLMHRTLERR